MSIYFITPINSETGQKFDAIEKRIKSIETQQRAIADEIGFHKWRIGHFTVFGGFSSVFFDTTPDSKVWKNVNGSKEEWMPKLNSKQGKLIREKLSGGEKIEKHELNACIGFKGAPLKTIGFTSGNNEYYGFSIGDDWEVDIPSDCEEVTRSRYRVLFEKEESK